MKINLQINRMMMMAAKPDDPGLTTYFITRSNLVAVFIKDHLWKILRKSLNEANLQQMTRVTENLFLYELRSEKTRLRGFRPGLTQTRLYNHTRWLEA